MTANLLELMVAYNQSVERHESEARKEGEKLLAQTAAGLKVLEDKLAAQGKLNALVQCQQAAKKVNEGLLDWQIAVPDPEIAAAQKSVLASRNRLELAQRQGRDQLNRQYLAQLEQLKISLTRQKKVAEALEVQAEADRVRAPLATNPSTAPAVPGVPGSRQGVPSGHVWQSFEQEQDLKAWEVRQGPPVGRATLRATDGKHAMLARPGNLLVCESIPQDWSMARAMAFDVFFTGDKPLPIEMVLGDQAWLDKLNYWNRHNRYLTLNPGPNRVVIPVTGLFRGEEKKQGSDIKGDLDLKRMRFLSIQCGPASAGGELHLDAFRLER